MNCLQVSSTKNLLVRNIFLLAAVGWTLFITYACLTTAANIPKAAWLNIEHKDKIVHFTFYLVFTLLWVLDLKKANKFSPVKARLFVFIFAVIFGTIIEICQGMFTAERSPDAFDVLANTSGSAAAILVLWILDKKK